MSEKQTSILLLSNVNLESIATPASNSHENVSIQYDGFNTIRMRLNEPLDQVVKAYDWVWLHADFNYPGLILENWHSHNGSDLFQHITDLLEQWIDRLASFTNNRFLVSSFHFQSLWNQGQADSLTQLELNYRLNQWLDHEVSQHSNIEIFPYGAMLIEYGEHQSYDPRLWTIARIPYTYSFLKKLKGAVCNHLAQIITQAPGKVLILDLDNTLWGGIIDEQESTPLLLDVEGLGLAYLNFQRAILGLQKRGILLAIVSKNDQKAVEAVLQDHPFMELKKECFVEIIANWEPKSKNILELSKQLGLNLDSFVMIDDNPREREEIRQALPQVVVPDFPEDPAELEYWFYTKVVNPYFQLHQQTTEDSQRTEQYLRRKKRSTVQANEPNLKKYLQSLDIRIIVKKTTPPERDRVKQLLNRTNQFNLNKTFLLESFDASAASNLWVLYYEDKFGKEGLVGALAITDDEIPFVKALAISCRVLGKGMEYALVHVAIESLKCKQLSFNYCYSRKNHLVGDFLKSLGATTLKEQTIINIDSKFVEKLKEPLHFISCEST